MRKTKTKVKDIIWRRSVNIYCMCISNGSSRMRVQVDVRIEDKEKK